jgi:2-iminobutanoate/2-iminopropanoate deaminase
MPAIAKIGWSISNPDICSHGAVKFRVLTVGEIMSRKIIKTDQAPAAIGPYNQANMAGGFLFTAGQIPLDPVTMEVVGETAAEQAQLALTNAKNVVEAGGLTLDNVLKVTVFIRDMGEFGNINAVYQTFFTGEPPARSVVEVSGLPKDVLVEVEMIAYG